MPIIFEYDNKSKIISTVANGVISARDMHNYTSEIIDRTDIMSGFIEVVDIEKVEDFIFRYSDTHALKILWPQFIEKGGVCSIIYAPTDLGYGIMRMLQSVLLDDDYTEVEKFILTRTREEVLAHIKRVRT